MEQNADFTQRVVIHTPQLEWQDSPMQGVRRRMLDRVGGEVARATSIVSYAPGSHFSSHTHTGGEEFLVLDGVFQDEHGDFPVGSYIRNPPESSHTPGSEDGCIIFVKLWQFDLNDRTQVMNNIYSADYTEQADRAGVKLTTLHEDARERVTMEHWEPDSDITLDVSEGAELLVIDGAFNESGDHLQTLSWMRIPVGTRHFTATTSDKGATVWVKTGHLKHAKAEAERLP